MTSKVLFVDDDTNILDACRRGLRKQFEIETAGSGAEGLLKLANDGPFAVVVSDMHMPGMNGVQFLSRAKDASPDTVRMMLTGNANLQTAMSALNEGNIFRFLIKPFSNDNISGVLLAGIEQYRLINAERDLLEKTLRGSVKILVEILSTISPELFGRAQGMRKEMRELADSLGMKETWSLELAAMLSQIGMVTLPPSIIAKIEKMATMTPSEQAIADRIPEISYGLLANIPRLETVANIIRNHRKMYEPTNPNAADIPVGSRLLKALTDLHAIQKLGVSRSGAVALLRNRAGGYDPVVIAAMVRLYGRAKDEEPAKTASTPIRLAQLRLGHVLAADLETEDGMMLVSSGHEITPTLLEKIANFTAISQVKEPVYVERPAGPALRRAA